MKACILHNAGFSITTTINLFWKIFWAHPAITFHRDQRSKNFIDSELTKIPGIGAKTAQKLLSAFKSTKKVKEAPFAAIAAEIGNAAAMKVVDYFGMTD